MQQPKLVVIDNLSGIEELAVYIDAQTDVIAYDIETTGLTKDSQIIGFSVCADESIAYYVILYKWNVAAQTLDPQPYLAEAKTLLQKLISKKLVAHNGVFDCWLTEAFFKIRLIEQLHADTMILAHLLDENRKVGLKELGAHYFGANSTEEQKEMLASIEANGGKTTKAEYELYKGDSYIIGKYGAKDAWLTYKLFKVLDIELHRQGLEKFFYEDESMPLLRGPTYDMNTEGLRLDVPQLHSLKKQLESECAEAIAYIDQEIAPYIKDKYLGTAKKNTFNIGSSQQMSWLLFERLKLPFGSLTKEGKVVCKYLQLRLPYTRPAREEFVHMCQVGKGRNYTPDSQVNGKLKKGKKIGDPWKYIAVDKKTLSKLAEYHEWIGTLLEYHKKTKLLDTYVSGMEQRVLYGVLHPSFLQHGTTSGRYSSRAPNFQNLPRDDKRIKKCIIARPGKVFVGADYSQLEPRVFAYVSNDSNLLAAFESGEDFYSVIGARVYGKHDCTLVKDDSPESFAVKYKSLRDKAKVIALASTYGATPYQLAPTMNKSIDDTAADMVEYFERFPGVADFMLGSHKYVKKMGYVTNIFGRPRRIPEAKNIEKYHRNKDHADLPYESRKLLNLAVNHRIQSTAASIVNRSAIKFHNNCKTAEIDCKIVLQVHDSLIVECDKQDAEDVALLLQDAMEATVELRTIRLEAVPRIGTNLSEV